MLWNAAFGWMLAVSAVMFVASLIALPLVVMNIPTDYLTRSEPRPGRFQGQHPAVVLTLQVLKNLLGAILLIAGLVMLFTPGQGLLAIVVGLSLLDLPGKRVVEQRVIGQPKVLRAINALRRKVRRPPLESPPKAAAADVRPHRAETRGP
jgi:Putative transmembrane protein (PGPGW)